MKKNRIHTHEGHCDAKIISTPINDFVHKLEVALKSTEVAGRDDITPYLKEFIYQVSKTYGYTDSDNPYIGKMTITPENGFIKADVWCKMACLDFEKQTGDWTPGIFDICRKIPYIAR